MRKAWLKKVKANHPDRLIAKHAGKDRISAATKKVASLNASYQRIIDDMKD